MQEAKRTLIRLALTQSMSWGRWHPLQRANTGALPSSAPHMPQKACLEIPGKRVPSSGSEPPPAQRFSRQNVSETMWAPRRSAQRPNRGRPVLALDPRAASIRVTTNLGHQPSGSASSNNVRYATAGGLKVVLAVFVVPNVRWPMVSSLHYATEHRQYPCVGAGHARHPPTGLRPRISARLAAASPQRPTQCWKSSLTPFSERHLSRVAGWEVE